MLSKMSKEEIEQMSYTELTEKILEEGKSYNTLELFNKICELLDLDKDSYADKIGDYYTTLATDKTFILLDNGKWDLQKNHRTDIVLEDETEDEELESIEEMSDEMDDLTDDLDDIDLDDIDEDDALDEAEDDLTILPEEELDD